MKNNIQNKKITDCLGRDQLSNIKQQVFKPDLVEFKLTLKNNTELSIPVTKDGYVNVTKLCKAGDKEYSHWKENKNSEATIQALERSIGIPRDLIIKDIKTGKNESRGTFVHRRLALIIAQWISADFAVQVAAWIENVNNIKSNKELSVSQSSDIVEFKLTLRDDTELSIPISKDGYAGY